MEREENLNSLSFSFSSSKEFFLVSLAFCKRRGLLLLLLLFLGFIFKEIHLQLNQFLVLLVVVYGLSIL